MKSRKDIGIAYLCWFFGLHYLYLGKPLVFLLYIFTLCGFGIWALVDIFRMPKMVRKYNADALKEQAIENSKAA